MGAAMTLEEVMQVASGEMLFVKWSGGNGPHLYEAVWHGDNLLACLPGLENGYPGEIVRRGDKRLINSVWRP